MGACCSCASKKVEEPDTAKSKQINLSGIKNPQFDASLAKDQLNILPAYLTVNDKMYGQYVFDEDCVGLNLDAYQSASELLKLSQQPDKLEIIHALIKFKFKLESVTEVAGLKHDTMMKYLDPAFLRTQKTSRGDIEYTLLSHNLSTRAWCPIHFAIFSDQLLYTKYFIE